MKWTSGKPELAGLYWWRWIGTTNPEKFHVVRLVLVNGKLVDRENGDPACDGEWAGPLEPPTEINP